MRSVGILTLLFSVAAPAFSKSCADATWVGKTDCKSSQIKLNLSQCQEDIKETLISPACMETTATSMWKGTKATYVIHFQIVKNTKGGKSWELADISETPIPSPAGSKSSSKKGGKESSSKPAVEKVEIPTKLEHSSLLRLLHKDQPLPLD